MDDGPESITDADEARVVRAQARAVFLRTLAATAVATAITWWLPSASAQQPESGRAAAPPGQVLFEDGFEGGLDGWAFPFGQGHRVVDAGSPRGGALALHTVGRPVYALVEGSEAWGDVRIEGLVRFPDDDDNYLGFIYRYVDDGRRIDFGSLYIKGNGSYVQANRHHDTNVGRTFLPEMRTDLTGARAITIGAWQSFALEVVGSEAHLYVGDMSVPAMTLRDSLAVRGGFGFKPRNPGAGVWIDQIRATSIRGFTYRGPPVPDPAYTPEAFVTDWSVLGPLRRHVDAVEAMTAFDPALTVDDDGRAVGWRPFPADHRGAVLTGTLTEFRGDRRVAYFHTRIETERAGAGTLLFSTVDDLAIWMNGVFVGFAPRQPYAWFDALTEERHAPVRARVDFRSGANDVVVRIVGGVYATGGFYLAARPPGS